MDALNVNIQWHSRIITNKHPVDLYDSRGGIYTIVAVGFALGGIRTTSAFATSVFPLDHKSFTVKINRHRVAPEDRRRFSRIGAGPRGFGECAGIWRENSAPIPCYSYSEPEDWMLLIALLVHASPRVVSGT